MNSIQTIAGIRSLINTLQSKAKHDWQLAVRLANHARTSDTFILMEAEIELLEDMVKNLSVRILGLDASYQGFWKTKDTFLSDFEVKHNPAGDRDDVIVRFGGIIAWLESTSAYITFLEGYSEPTGIPASQVTSSTTYDVALSFAGEDRHYAKEIADYLREAGFKVFYDEYERASLWGKNLYEHLSEVYNKKASYCVIFVSENYSRKLWTNHERKSAQARAFHENREYILPIRLDDTQLSGLLETTGYLDGTIMTMLEIANILMDKLKQQNQSNS